MTTYTSPFTGNAVQPTDVSFASVALAADLQLYWPQYANATEQVAARIMEVNASTSGLQLFLPDATQASVGEDILIRNTGANSFAVTRFGGTGSFTVASGQSFYTYITDNTTQAGVWADLQFGTGTSTADAATLAGNSTVAILGKLEASFITNEFVTSPVVTNASRGQCFVWKGGVGTIVLPAVADLDTGWFISVRNNGSGALTIDTASLQSTIDGNTTITLPLGDSCFICVNRDPSKQDFFTVGRARPNSLTFTSATYDVDSIAGPTLSLITNTPIIQRFTALSGSRTTSLLVELPAVTQVYYVLNDTGQSGYNIEFQVQGSLQAPFVLANANQAILLSDGTNVYPMIQSSSGLVSAVRGTAAAPAITFADDPITGLYSPNNSQLGFTVGGINIATMDGTGGISALVTNFKGQLNAELIAGGSF